MCALVTQMQYKSRLNWNWYCYKIIPIRILSLSFCHYNGAFRTTLFFVSESFSRIYIADVIFAYISFTYVFEALPAHKITQITTYWNPTSHLTGITITIRIAAFMPAVLPQKDNCTTVPDLATNYSPRAPYYIIWLTVHQYQFTTYKSLVEIMASYKGIAFTP